MTDSETPAPAASPQTTETDDTLFFGFKERPSDDAVYQVTCSGTAVPEETVAYYASLFPDTIYFASNGTTASPTELG